MNGRAVMLLMTMIAVLVLLAPVMPAGAQGAEPWVHANPNEQVAVGEGSSYLEITDGPPIDLYASVGPVQGDSGIVTTILYPDLDGARGVAWADYGRLTFSAWAKGGVADPYWGTASTWGGAAFNDRWTISNPDLNGAQGTVQFVFSVTGAWGYNCRENYPVMCSAYLRVNNDPNHTWPISDGGVSVVVQSGGYFTFGSPFQFTITLGVNASAGATQLLSTADFTAQLTGIRVYDYDGNRVASYSVLAESAYDYGLLFHDDFESGDAGAWSAMVP